MIRIAFNPEALTGAEKAWWDAWAARAKARQEADAKARIKGEEPAFDKQIWSDLKTWLLDQVFHGKCAYCEFEISPGFFGDAEHYRPKGNVTVMANETRTAALLACGTPHGGYHWLSYDWRNLLPSCEKCNNAKSDQFPVAVSHDGEVGKTTQDLNAAEQPLLLYPYEDEPCLYLRFGKAGVVVPVDEHPRGKETIRILGLDRRKLAEARWREQGKAIQSLETPVAMMFSSGSVLVERFEQNMGPHVPFSRAIRDWFDERCRILHEGLDLIRQSTRRGG